MTADGEAAARTVRRIASDHGFDEAHEAPVEAVALWIARRFRLMAEHATDVISIHDLEGRFQYVSAAAVKVLGREPEELVGRSAFELAHPDDRDRLRTALTRMAEGESVADQVFRMPGPEGETPWLEVSGRIVERDDRPRLVASTRDVTRRMLLHDAIARSRRLEAVGRLAGGVAHELNNRFTVMKGELALFDVDSELGPDQRDGLRRLGEAVDRATEVVRNLLAFSGLRPSDLEVLDLNPVVEDAVPALEDLVGPGVELSVRLADRPIPAAIDRDGLLSVLRILVENADEAMPDGGRVSVSVETREEPPRTVFRDGVGAGGGRWAALTVEDTGPGIDPAVRDRVFEPFASGRGPTEAQGLGLAVAYGIVEELGGTIVIDSGEDGGARIRVFLPTA